MTAEPLALGESCAPADLRRFEAALATLLEDVPVAGWRLGLVTRAVDAPLAVLRSVFGLALHDLDEAVYRAVFRPEAADGAPGYVLRRAPYQGAQELVVDLILTGESLCHLPTIRRAWELAGEYGLGKHREPFRVQHHGWLDPWGRACIGDQPCEPFPLSLVGWPLSGDPAREPCRLLFPEPLRILRQKRVVTAPTLRDLAVAGLRRLGGLVRAPDRLLLRELQQAALAAADQVAAMPWRGERTGVRRWSSSQGQEIDLHGVVGSLDLPEGPGCLWRLLAALQWVHVGKATVQGFGRLVVLPVW